MKGHQGWSFFAVFDGHAGNAAAEFCKTALIDEVEEKMKVSFTRKLMPKETNVFDKHINL